jgi:hypothetical protein
MSDARLAVLDGAVDLQPVWELLEAQPGWEPTSAVPPLCFVKVLEPRLQITFNLPHEMAGLDDAAIKRYAVGCKPNRGDVDSVIHGKGIGRASGAVRAVDSPPTEGPKVARAFTPRRKAIVGVAALVTLACAGIVAHSLLGAAVPTPTLTKMETTDFAGAIPLRSAQRWGAEVHASLADPSWLERPEAERREQLEAALERLSDRKLSVLIIEDDAKRPKASAQLFGKPPKPFVRFY